MARQIMVKDPKENQPISFVSKRQKSPWDTWQHHVFSGPSLLKCSVSLIQSPDS